VTSTERERAAAFLDLEAGRQPVPILDDAGIERVLRDTRRIAVIGASSNPERPSFGVFRDLVGAGFECVPINPNERAVQGVPAFPNLAEAVEAGGPVDLVDVFRRSELCVPHAREAVAAGARTFWLQLGIVQLGSGPDCAQRRPGSRDGSLHLDRMASDRSLGSYRAAGSGAGRPNGRYLTRNPTKTSTSPATAISPAV